MYHKLTIEETLKALDVDPETGLSDKEAAARAPHSEDSDASTGFLHSLSETLLRPGVYALAAAAIISAFLGNYIVSIIIILTVVLNHAFAAECRRRAERILNRAVNFTVTHAIVLRNGAKMKLPSDELCVGDVVTIKPGRVVPADLRLITSENLTVDESALTGDSFPVRKDCSFISKGDIPFEDRKNTVYGGTVVTGGRADGVVVATGMSTVIGQMAMRPDLPEQESSPEIRKIEKLSDLANTVTIFTCILIFAIGIIRGLGFLDTAMTSLALLVAAVPETIYGVALASIAFGISRMKKRGISAKSILSAEMLGEVTAFCTDIPKIGVALTYSEGERHFPHEEKCVPFIDGLLLCDSGDASLCAYAEKMCKKSEVTAAFPKIGGLSGELTTTLHRAGNTTISYTCGVANKLIPRCDRIWKNGAIKELTSEDLDDIREMCESFSDDGFIPKALGMRFGDTVPSDRSLIFLGIAATRASSEEGNAFSVPSLREEGVEIYLVTEENAEKARYGAESIGIPCKKIICGSEVSALSDSELCKKLEETYVYSDILAQERVRIINALKSMGHSVASIGDTINDAPGLDAADVGLSDIHAKDAAKDAADIILDGDGASAEKAIHIGKSIVSNIKAAAMYLLSGNLGELICVLVAVILGMGTPLLPIHILILNIITDALPAFAMAMRGAEIKKTVPEKLMFVFGIIPGVAALVVYTIILNSESTEAARTAAFVTITLGELFMSLVTFAGGDIFQKNVVTNKYAVAAFLIGVALVAVCVFIPAINTLFGGKAISGAIFGAVAAAALLPLLLSEAFSQVFGRKNRHRKNF